MFKTLSLAVIAMVATGADAHRHHHQKLHQRHAHGHSLVGGIDEDDIMQNQASHWKKSWPQGDTDNGVDDENVMNLKGDPRKAKKKPDVYTYPWKLDSDVVDSAKHLADTEKVVGKQFGQEGWQDRGLAILNSGDRHIKSWAL